jgi:hypothetical protein
MNKGGYVILPDESIFQKIERSLNDTDNLRKWVGNRLIYQDAKRWSEYLQSNNNYTIELPESHEIIVLLWTCYR